MAENPNNPPFSLAAKRTIVKAVQRILATPQGNPNTLRPAKPRSIGELLVFGKVATNWSAGVAHVELTPCLDYDDATATGEPNVYGFPEFDNGTAAVPAMFPVNVGDILAGIVLDPTASPPTWLIVAPAILTPGTADYQVLQMSGGVAVWDWVKSH